MRSGSKGFGKRREPDRHKVPFSGANGIPEVTEINIRLQPGEYVSGMDLDVVPDENGLYSIHAHTTLDRRARWIESPDLNLLLCFMRIVTQDFGRETPPEAEMGLIRRINRDGYRIGMPEGGRA